MLFSIRQSLGGDVRAALRGSGPRLGGRAWGLIAGLLLVLSVVSACEDIEKGGPGGLETVDVIGEVEVEIVQSRDWQGREPLRDTQEVADVDPPRPDAVDAQEGPEADADEGPVETLDAEPPEEVVELVIPEEVVELVIPEEVVETVIPEEVVELVSPEEVVEVVLPEEVVELVVPEEVVELVSPEEVVEVVIPEEVVEAVIPDEVIEAVIPEEVVEAVIPEEVVEVVIPDEVVEVVIPDEVAEVVIPDEVAEVVIPDEIAEVVIPDVILDTVIPDVTFDAETPDEAVDAETSEETLDAVTPDEALNGETLDSETAVDTGPDEEAELVGFLGAFSLTYYFMVYETSFLVDAQGQELPDLPTTELRDVSCATLAEVATSFADAVCVEGSGMLRDGQVVNVDLDCGCGHPCPNGRTLCFLALDAEDFPYGMGAEGNALEPLRSVATDPSVLPYGTVVYLPDWDGLVIPDVDELGAFVHDGCFRADDIGHGVDGYHLDIFAASHGMWQALELQFPTGTELPAYDDPGHCAGLLGAEEQP